MSITINTNIYDKELDDKWFPDDNSNDIDPDDFEEIYREYCDQGMWEEHEIQFDTYSQNI